MKFLLEEFSLVGRILGGVVLHCVLETRALFLQNECGKCCVLVRFCLAVCVVLYIDALVKVKYKIAVTGKSLKLPGNKNSL